MTTCDFCSSPEVRWRYPAASFVSRLGGSFGDWAACNQCHTLIEADRRVALAQRSADTLIMKRVELLPFAEAVLDDIVALHIQFFANRGGAACPHSEAS